MAARLDDPLDDFTIGTGGPPEDQRAVYRKGTGPAVLVLAEIPGITPAVANAAREIAAIGCTAVLPQLFGRPGADLSEREAMGVLARTCIRREFNALVLRRSSPVTDWLRALAKAEHERCGGPGVGVVGMCLTGGFALAMLAEPAVLAPVLCQPSLPLPVSPWHARDLGVSPAYWEAAKRRVESEDLCVLGLRFEEDAAAPRARFDRLSQELGARFARVDLPPRAPGRIPMMKRKHSVITREREAGVPGTAEAFAQVLALFREKLLRDS